MTQLDVTNITFTAPRRLKNAVFSKMALREQKFSYWMREKMEEYLIETEDPEPYIPTLRAKDTVAGKK
jgi:hypothetical protein